jgi:hypothetical protein
MARQSVSKQCLRVIGSDVFRDEKELATFEDPGITEPSAVAPGRFFQIAALDDIDRRYRVNGVRCWTCCLPTRAILMKAS